MYRRLLVRGRPTSRTAELNAPIQNSYRSLRMGYANIIQQAEWIDDAAFALGEARGKNPEMRDGADWCVRKFAARYPSQANFILMRRNKFGSSKRSITNKDASLQKLALLIGDVIAQKSKGILRIGLAEITSLIWKITILLRGAIFFRAQCRFGRYPSTVCMVETSTVLWTSRA